MAPPPRPPIICYDLQTTGNARKATDSRYRVPSTGTVRKTKVTIVQRDVSELDYARAEACWHTDSPRKDCRHQSENNPIHRSNPINDRTKQSLNPQDKVVRVNTYHHNKNSLHSKPYPFNTLSFGSSSTETSKANTAAARHAYGQKLKLDAEERERRLETRRQYLAMQAKLDELSEQIGSSKRAYETVLKTYGMSHNAARYIQQQDEDFAKLKRKIDQFAEARSKELGRRVQQMKRFHENQKIHDRKLEERRLKDVSPTANRRQNWNSTMNNSLSSSSQTTNTATTNTASPSSTISISSCSSPMSTEEYAPSIHFAQPPNYKSTTKLPTSTILSSSTPVKSIRKVKNSSTLNSNFKDKFSFYKPNPLEANTILEVTDVDFFDNVEDKTMLGINELFNKMQSGLRDISRELQ